MEIHEVLQHEKGSRAAGKANGDMDKTIVVFSKARTMLVDVLVIQQVGFIGCHVLTGHGILLKVLRIWLKELKIWLKVLKIWLKELKIWLNELKVVLNESKIRWNKLKIRSRVQN